MRPLYLLRHALQSRDDVDGADIGRVFHPELAARLGGAAAKGAGPASRRWKCGRAPRRHANLHPERDPHRYPHVTRTVTPHVTRNVTPHKFRTVRTVTPHTARTVTAHGARTFTRHRGRTITSHAAKVTPHGARTVTRHVVTPKKAAKVVTPSGAKAHVVTAGKLRSVPVHGAGRTTISGHNFSVWRTGYRVRHGRGWRTFVALSTLSAIAIGSSDYYPYAYISAPEPYCEGLTEDGCQLMWQEVETTDGDIVNQCVAYCPWQ
jgi:hypothetical protein